MSKLNLNVNLKGYEGNNANVTANTFSKNLQYVGVSIENHICQEVKVEATTTKTIFEVPSLDAKSLVYIECSSICDIIINDTQEVTVKPVVTNGTSKNGIFLNTNSIEKLEIRNNELIDISIYLIAAK